jgi:hypothetical protein
VSVERATATPEHGNARPPAPLSEAREAGTAIAELLG